MNILSEILWAQIIKKFLVIWSVTNIIYINIQHTRLLNVLHAVILLVGSPWFQYHEDFDSLIDRIIYYTVLIYRYITLCMIIKVPCFNMCVPSRARGLHTGWMIDQKSGCMRECVRDPVDVPVTLVLNFLPINFSFIIPTVYNIIYYVLHYITIYIIYNLYTYYTLYHIS